MEKEATLDKRAEEIEKEYLSSLADLNVNSKPLINMLTILAEENLEYAHIIVNAVEKHLAQVGPDVKLPILYLVDSIVKNVGKQYQSLFSQVIVNMFCGVFQTAHDRVREKMFNLRLTWNDLFPQSKLYALDIKINSMDSGWPITASLKPKTQPSIHLNPKFLNQQPGPEPTATATIHAQLEEKRRELLELQTRKLELELLATRKRIAEQEKQLSIQTASVAKGLPPIVRKPLDGASSAPPGLPMPPLSGSVGGLLSAAGPAVPVPAAVPGSLKSRIAPVSQGMISMISSRDPRLMKQQASSANSQPPFHAPPGGPLRSMGMLSHGNTVLGGLHGGELSHHGAPLKVSMVSIKDRLGAKVKRLEGNGVVSAKHAYGAASDGSSMAGGGGGRTKKVSPSSGGSGSVLSRKSRHDHHEGSGGGGGKSRRERHAKDRSTSSGSSKGSSGSPGKSSAIGRTVSGGEKRKQHGGSSSSSSTGKEIDGGSSQSQKSPGRSPGKKKSSPDKPALSPGGSTEKLRTERKALPTVGKLRKPSANSSSSRADAEASSSSAATALVEALGNVTAAPSQDVDLRCPIPEKRKKMAGGEAGLNSNHSMAVAAEDTEEVIVPVVGPKASQIDVQSINSAQAEEDALAELISKDIDLRKLPLQLMPPAAGGSIDRAHGSRSGSTEPPRADEVRSLNDSPRRRTDAGADELMVEEFALGKKRGSGTKSDEPTAKKSKAEMIDALFGNEDVDLRQLPMESVLLEAGVPPPLGSGRDSDPFGMLDNAADVPRSPLSEKNSRGSRFSDIVGKGQQQQQQDKDKLGRPLLYNKLPDDPIERRRSLNKAGDVDLRQQPHLRQQQHLPAHLRSDDVDEQDDDSSMDSMNANIKTIVAQAQEQMEKGEINLEQYNILMKQVIQLNETQKIRQAQRIEQRQDPTIIRIDDNGSQSGEDDVIITSATVPAASGNDFRGKIHPLEAGGKVSAGGPSALGKPPLGGPFLGAAGTSVPPPDLRVQRDPRRMRESKWNRVEPASPAWANRTGTGVGPSGQVGPVRGGGGPPINVPSPWEQAPFPMGVPDQGGRFAPGALPTLAPPPGLGGGPPVVLNGASGQPPLMAMSTLAKLQDSVRTINIDGIQREIRFYEETAVIFMNWDEPKEIGFQKGARMVCVDDRETFELGFNEPYKSVSIEGKVYQMRLGAPTRELYIDDSWYECYFGDPPTTIMLGEKPRVFKIAGPPPQVKIGSSRNDLVAGKINMIVDAELIVPVFLDCKPQLVEIGGHQHWLQFADFLLTVLIDDQPFSVEFGGLPQVYRLRERNYYIRFTALPKLVVPGRVYIRDMVRTPHHRDLRTPPKDASLLPPLPVLGPAGVGGPLLSHPPPPGGVFIGPPHGGGKAGSNLHGHMQSPANTLTGLDYITNLMPTMAMQTAGGARKNLPGYRIEADDKVPPAASVGGDSGPGGVGLPALGNINVEELYKKIVAAGIITKMGAQGQSGGAPNAGPQDGGSGASKDTAKDDGGGGGGKSKERDSKSSKDLPPIDPVLLDKPDTLRRRQAAIVHQLFCGMQCSSCGVRFPPEQTMKYSQHLDWHFRQNRRDRDSARKAHSRKWYYDVSDWIQYEEIEDLEEREKNWFETQQTDHGIDGATKRSGTSGSSGGVGGPGGEGEEGSGGASHSDSPVPSCPAGTDEGDRQCHMCHDVFEQFYNEETEDWHLKSAVRVDGYTYHPLCYEDYKASLTMSETTLGNASHLGGAADESQKTEEMDSDGEDQDEDGGDRGDGCEPGEGGPRRRVRKASGKRKAKVDGDNNDDDDDDDDDDVIVLPTEEPVVEEILDDDAEDEAGNEGAPPAAAAAAPPADPTAASGDVAPPVVQRAEFQERQVDEDVFIQEPNIEVTDLDDIEDQPEGSDHGATGTSNGAGGGAGAEDARPSVLQVKIKQEPKDEYEGDEEDALFEDVGTIESSLIEVADDRRSPSSNVVGSNPTEEGDAAEDGVQVEGVPSPADNSGSQAVPPAQMQSKASIDGNMDPQDAPQAAVLVPNKIKINITTAKAISNSAPHETSGENGAETNGTEDAAAAASSPSRTITGEVGEEMFEELSNDGVVGWEEMDEPNGAGGGGSTAAIQSNNKDVPSTSATTSVAFEETTDVAYEKKPALQGIELSRLPRVTSGCEASGLCSIM
ncbi:uncharacterized protein LOC131212794 [Anopheles bellator]|uniref:uncharacterized protein LOC131212794 n=1 Tax=Anopheles bellator TaxID=139047 RepID=UPI002648169E|nr:uncharacterized protein LOC131212794 [Anopheles bellator]